jgi:HSP20 family protein
MSYNTLTNYIDSIFDDFTAQQPVSRMLSTSPTLNIDESDSEYVITVTVPGINPEQLDIEVVDHTLQIRYDHSEEDEANKKGKTIRREYSHYSFSRSISLPKNVDTGFVEAETHNGILTITIRKSPETQPQKIAIKNRD